ncbi:MAG: hypothetical protein RLZZ156_192 [Deinococcota bacterium]|jgi:predicted DNA-binding transcriptional regulator YafY
MYSPTLRLLAVLELLESKEKVTGLELTQKLEVSSRSVQRYIVQLQDLGIPVESTRGVGGAYRLKAGFRLPPLVFSNEEALALSLGLQALEPLGLTTFAPAQASAQSKLRRVLPTSIAEQMQMVQDTVRLEPFPWLVKTPTSMLLQLLKASHASQPIQFAYSSARAEITIRVVEPYNLLHFNRRWYLVGYCRLRSAPRVFRLDRVSEIVLLEGSFERPLNFDALQFLRDSIPFASAPWNVEVLLDLPITEAHWRVMPHYMALEEVEAGTIVRFGSSDLEWVAAILLSFKCDFKVIQPPELLEAFNNLAIQAKRFSQYGNTG